MTDLELAYRKGRLSSRDITLMSRNKVDGTFRQDDDKIPIIVRACSFVWERPIEVLRKDGSTKRAIKILTPWIRIQMTTPPYLFLWCRLSDPGLTLNFNLDETLISSSG